MSLLGKQGFWGSLVSTAIFAGAVTFLLGNVSLRANDAPAPVLAVPPTPVKPIATEKEVKAEDLMVAGSPQLRPLAEMSSTNAVGTNVVVRTNALTAAIPRHDGREKEEESLQSEMMQQAVKRLKGDLEAARHLRATRQSKTAVPILTKLLADGVPDFVQRDALLELGYGAQDENDLARAQTIFAQFISRWPNDSRAPEVLLRQGQIFRDMGLNNLALAKFYAVMTAALSLKSDQLDFYQKLVLKAQTEIAESNYQIGKFAEAADFFARLLKQNEPGLDRPQIQFRLLRSLAAVSRNEETVGQAQDFLTRYSDAPQTPEVRFILAQALKHLGRNSDSLQQVLVLLREQKARTKSQPEVWAYWQQRAGNEIANQLYREGDYTKALDVYLSLAQLDSAPAWQLPVYYQVGMTFERLSQPQESIEVYAKIIARAGEVGTNSTPGLRAVIDMAKWRSDFLKWQGKAEVANRAIANPPPPEALVTNAPVSKVARQ